MTLINQLKNELSKATSTKNSSERAIRIAAIIAEALRNIKQDSVLVGGAAVEFYTQGAYSTSDIDMIAEGGPELITTMEDLGFEKLGKDFIHQKLNIYIEFPGRNLKENEQSVVLKIKDKTLKIISLEDLIVDRLCAFKFWQSAIDGLNSLLLLENNDLDENRLSQRAQEEKVEDALKGLLKIREEIIRKKILPKSSNEMLENLMKELH